MTDLVSTGTRGRFRSLMTDGTLGAIDTAFQGEGTTPNPHSTYQDSSARRSRTQEYLDSVDWTDPDQVGRALRAIERLVYDVQQSGSKTEPFAAALRRDGYQTDPTTGHITPLGPQFPSGSLANLPDADAIREHLDRIQRAASTDPALAIGSAKELIESTAKGVLGKLGVPAPPNADLPILAKTTQKALGIHPSAATPGPDGSEAVKRILSSVTKGLSV